MKIDVVKQVADAYLKTAEGTAASRLRFLTGLWEIQAEIEQAERAYEAPAGDAAREALAAGKPLFTLGAPEVPLEAYTAAVARIAAYTADNAGLDVSQAGALRATDFAAAITPELLAVAVSAPQRFVDETIAALGTDEEPLAPATAAFVLVSALVPFLTGPAAAALAAAGTVDRTVWSAGTCPVCGSPAAIGRVGESTSLQGADRTLWCGLCHTEWEYDRLRCVRCGTRVPESLHYSHVEEDPAHRLHLCSECHGYAKFVWLNDLDKRVAMVVEDAVTAPLDAIAVAEGYSATGDVVGQAH